MLVGLVCLIVLVLAYQATRTALALNQVKKDVATLGRQVRDGDADAAKVTLRELRGHAGTAHANSDNVLWSGISRLPWIGGDIRAVRVVASSLDTSARRALPVAVEIYDTVTRSKLRSDGGRFDTAAIAALEPRFRRLSAGLAPAERELDGIEPDQLRLPTVRSATQDFQDQLSALVTLGRAGTTATEVLPGMLGADGPRTYLLVVQNNAELRATGGLAGSLLTLRTNQGKLTLGKRSSAGDFLRVPAPVVRVTDEEKQLYGLGIAQDIREANETPDFPRVGQIINGFSRATYGRQVDGVIAIDPIALASLLKATGPIKVGGESFTSENTVRKLLNTVYLRYTDPKVQDAYFAGVAKGIFDRLSSRPVNQLSVVRTLAQAVSERRFLVWSNKPAESRELRGTTITGALPTGTAGRTSAGMYLNDAASGKMQYYLDHVGGIRPVSCTGDGTQRFDVQLRLRSTAPADAASLPIYITGDGSNVAKGSMRMSLRIYGPVGGKIVGLEANGKKRDPYLFTADGRPVAFLFLTLKPQGRINIVARVETPSGGRGRPELAWTPGVRTGATSISAESACG